MDSFVPGGPAEWHLSQGGEKIRPGDILVEINGTVCYAAPVDKISQLILGPAGTWVQLGFKRSELNGSVKVIRIRLERRPFLCPIQRHSERADTDAAIKAGILKTKGAAEPADNKNVSFKF